MKIKELLATLEKSDNNRDWIDLENLGQEFQLQLFGYNIDYDNLALKAWFHQDASWICTDTKVGLKFYFLNDELVAISTQQGRKDDEYFHFINDETREKVFNWIVEAILKKNLADNKNFDLDSDASSWIRSKKDMDELNKKYP